MTMTTEAPVVRGVQEPRIVSIPPYTSSAGREAIDLCAQIGLHLDPWQKFVLHHALGEREDGRWAAFEVGLIVSRQNGKDALFEARELAGLFLFGEQLLLHSTHEFKTTLEHFRRVLFWLENVDWLSRRVKRVRTSHGEECVELRTGQRLRFVARTTGSGRGFSGDLVVLNEAFHLPAAAVDALMPTLSARPNPRPARPVTGSASSRRCTPAPTRPRCGPGREVARCRSRSARPGRPGRCGTRSAGRGCRPRPAAGMCARPGR